MVKRSNAYVTLKSLDEQTARWLRKVRDQVRPRPHLRLKQDRCALLVVDMVNYFASPGERAYLPATAAILPTIARLVNQWTDNGNPVYFTQHCHEGEHDLGMLGHFFSDYIRCHRPEADIIAALPQPDSATIIRKATYDAFYGTDLEAQIRATQADQVLITGVLTHMCVATTARSAFVRGFKTFIAADGTASSTEEFHTSALLTLADSVAIVVASDEVLKS
jgi:isochorismate hydrolase